MLVPVDPFIRERIHLTGSVQGVGFRPFVYRLATSLALAGFVGNNNDGVFIEVQGHAAVVDRFKARLLAEAPPAAFISGVYSHGMKPHLETGFSIVSSNRDGGDMPALVLPDLPVCDDCLRDLRDSSNRRYRYPFINCTNCGPRFTIVEHMPYDRPHTTMSPFTMCPDCRAEYGNPLDRRFHAQPIACPDCGPQVTFVHGDAAPQHADGAVRAAIAALADGKIVAVKGVGGFHLTCDATHAGAVTRLRERKHRPHKPLAVMVRDVAQAKTLAYVSEEEVALLTGRERPIVLLYKRDNAALANTVSPDIGTVGLMLPSTPLHHLLAEQMPLVMTSANHSGEPIITDNEDALTSLSLIADAFLLHDRIIYTPCDDSVVTVAFPVRRSRGVVPQPLPLPVTLPPLLAVGGELKNTFCLAKGNQAFMSQHIGDMQNLETLSTFEHSLENLQHLCHVKPQFIIHDMHPGYLSTRWAQRHAARHNLPCVAVQHHHAHIAAVMAEHCIASDETVIGFAFDGTGYGTDGTVWGGEVLLANYRSFERVAHVAYMPLPGGDTAIRRTYRLALAYLWACDLPWDEDLLPVMVTMPNERRILLRQLAASLNTVQTSSMGRLFDAVAGLLGVCCTATFEAQAAMQLEAMCTDDVSAHYPVSDSTFDPAPVLASILEELRAGVPVSIIAAKFHNTVATWVLQVAMRLRQLHNLDTVALSGGVFQNRYLLERVQANLEQYQFTMLTHRQVPPNDGGLSLGQAIVGYDAAKRSN